MGIKEWVLLIVLSIIWGGSFFFVGVAVKELPPLTIVMFRVALASIILLAVVYLKGEKMPFSLGIWGAFIVMGAAVSYAFAAIYGRRFKEMNPIVVAAGMLCGSTIMMTPLALYFDQPWNLAPGAMTMISIVGLAAISTSLAYIIYFHVLAIAGPTNLLLVTFLIPISAIILGVLGLGEQLGWEVFVGMG